MRHIIIGTAGHVDHGKTALTMALTGVNTDRWQEERDRGITLDLGFASLTLPSGQQASIVDVPGHEKLINNMLAGATGFDVVLFVVAADEGFMPQSQEHLDILSLLDVDRGIIVVTKRDLVEDDWLEMVMQDIRDRVEGTFLADAPMLPVSSYTGEGIDALLEKIDEMVAVARPNHADRPFRLPIDRVFSIKGAGTVVTGTLTEGRVHVGDECALYPKGTRVRIRELQTHDVSESEAEAGMRVAANLADIGKSGIARGCTLAMPDSLYVSRRATVRLQVMKDAAFPVKNASQLHFYLGTQQLVCKVRLLDADELAPGDSGFAQLAFEKDLAARPGDRFVVRFFSPVMTVGGGKVLELGGRSLRRKNDAVIERLRQLDGTPEQRLFQLVTDARCSLVTPEELAKEAGLSVAEVMSALEGMLKDGEVVSVGGGYVSEESLARLAEMVDELLRSYHAAHPLESGMRLGELRERLASSPLRVTGAREADALLAFLEGRGVLSIFGSRVALAGFDASYSPEQEQLHSEIVDLFRTFGFEVPTTEEVAARFEAQGADFSQVFSRMKEDGELVALTPQVLVTRSVYDAALGEFLEMFADADSVALGDYRTKLGVSRKYAQLFLDAFDRAGISRLVGDRRVLLKR